MNWKWSLLATLVFFGCPEGGGGYMVFDGSELTGTVTWSGTVEVKNSFSLKGTLTLAKCTTVLLPPGGIVSVMDNGALKAEGTADCPVTLRSVKNSPAAGDWSRIEFQRTSSNDSLLAHTHVLHGGSEYGALWVDEGASLGLDAVTFEQLRDTGVQWEPTSRVTQFRDVRFVNSADVLVRVPSSLAGSLSAIATSGVSRPRVVVRDDLSAATTWRNLGVALQVPSMNVRGGALEVEAGTVLQLEPGAVIGVFEGGALRFLGTSTSPVTVESSKTSPAPGDWLRFDVYATSQANNLFRNVVVRHGGDANYGVLWLEDGATFGLEQTTFTSNSSCDVSASGTLNALASTFERCL